VKPHWDQLTDEQILDWIEAGGRLPLRRDRRHPGVLFYRDGDCLIRYRGVDGVHLVPMSRIARLQNAGWLALGCGRINKGKPALIRQKQVQLDLFGE
jgi:hypothetical protein